MSLFNLKDKSILITGSSRGIGKSIAHHCALHGAKVIISSRKLDACEATASEINKAVGTEAAFPIPANISDENQLNDLVSLTKEKLGRIDTLICCALCPSGCMCQCLISHFAVIALPEEPRV